MLLQAHLRRKPVEATVFQTELRLMTLVGIFLNKSSLKLINISRCFDEPNKSFIWQLSLYEITLRKI